MKKMKYIIVIPCLILVAVSAVVLKECHTDSAMSDNSAEEQAAEKQQMSAVAETDAEGNEDTETDTLSEEELVSSDNALFDRACLLNSLYECKLNLEARNRDLLRGVQDKQSADSAAKSCEAALAERRVLEHLIGSLFPMPEEVYEAVLYSGSYAISAELAVDEECKRLLTAAVPAYGSAELEAVLKGRPKATMSAEELNSFLAETYESQESVAALAVETAGKISALLQRIRDAESARGVLPELKQAVEHLCTLQKEHSMFFFISGRAGVAGYSGTAPAAP